MSGDKLIRQDERNAKAISAARTIVEEYLTSESPEWGISNAYPANFLKSIAETGLFGMAIPEEYGGLDLDIIAQAHIFSILASGNLTAAFILSQHHGCTHFIVSSENHLLKSTWLGGLAKGEHQASQGFNFLNFPAQNTPMKAIPDGNGYILDGTLPWVTAAETSDITLAGAFLPNGQQLLATVPIFTLAAQEHPKVIIDKPMELSALNGSQTSKVHFHNVRVLDSWVVLGPGDEILKHAARGSSGFVATYLTLGHARASMRIIEAAVERNPGMVTPMLKWVQREIIELQDIVDTTLHNEDYNLSAQLRGQGNALAARAAHFALIASGGSGYQENQLAQQLYREAAFFSVWSVSGNIIPETISHLLTPL